MKLSRAFSGLSYLKQMSKPNIVSIDFPLSLSLASATAAAICIEPLSSRGRRSFSGDYATAECIIPMEHLAGAI